MLQFSRPRVNGGLALISCKILEMVVPAPPKLFLGVHLLDTNEWFSLFLFSASSYLSLSQMQYFVFYPRFWVHLSLSLTHTHTHTHTHVGFYGLWGLSIGVMVFILYKLYVLLPYTYPTPKLSPHRRRCISTFPPKNSLCMIYKCFKLWGHWKCPHKSPSPCNTYVIPMSLYKFVSS